ncbi:hypothetical protein HKD37_04G010635 [Glycine soja]
MKLRMMKAMFDCDSHLAKKLTTCLNDLSLAPSFKLNECLIDGTLSLYSDAILPRKGPITRTMSKRLQEDWARAAEEGPRVLMNLRTHLLLEVASPLSFPFSIRCHSSSKKQRNPLMKKILGLQAPMELASYSFISYYLVLGCRRASSTENHG